MANSSRRRRTTAAPPVINDGGVMRLVQHLYRQPLRPRVVRLSGLAISLAGIATALLFWQRGTKVHVPNATPRELARAAIERPADWRLMRDITAASLDLPVRDRKTLWLRSYVAARELTDGWDPAARDLVRSGLFHWSELSDEERAMVLAAARKLMRDRDFFDRNLQSFWSLTRDVAYLETARPPGSEPLARIARLAANHGEFGSYRRIREELAREREREILTLAESRASSNEILRALLEIPVDQRNRRTLIRALTTLAERPPSLIGIDQGKVERFLRDLLDNGLPVIAFVPLAEDSDLPRPFRARIALAAGDRPLADRIEREAGFTGVPEWTEYHVERIRFDRARGETVAAAERLRSIHADDREHPAVVALGGPPRAQSGSARTAGLCSDELICSDRAVVTLFTPSGTRRLLELTSPDDSPASPYVEIRLDGKLIAEFALPRDPLPLELRAGLHRIEVRLANPVAPSGERRRVRMRIT